MRPRKMSEQIPEIASGIKTVPYVEGETVEQFFAKQSKEWLVDHIMRKSELDYYRYKGIIMSLMNVIVGQLFTPLTDEANTLKGNAEVLKLHDGMREVLHGMRKLLDLPPVKHENIIRQLKEGDTF